MFQELAKEFGLMLSNLGSGVISFLPNLVIAIIVFIIGWVVGSVVGKAIGQVISAIKIDKLFQNAGAEEVLAKAGMRLSVGGFIGGLVKWFIVVVFLMTSFWLIGLSQVNDFLREVVISYLPQVIIAALILVLATVIADVTRKIVSGTAKVNNIRSANFLGAVSFYSIWVFALIIALYQLGIAREFMQILFTGIIAMLAIAGGLAFGLGGRDAASKAIEKMKEDMGHKM